MKLVKICLFCQLFHFSTAEPDWSELTPGHDAEIYCSKGFWEYEPFRWMEEDYRRAMLTAQTCEDFQLCAQLAERDDIILIMEEPHEQET